MQAPPSWSNRGIPPGNWYIVFYIFFTLVFAIGRRLAKKYKGKNVCRSLREEKYSKGYCIVTYVPKVIRIITTITTTITIIIMMIIITKTATTL